MTFIEQVHQKRKKLADVLVDEEYSGLRELVEELYPDKAHFIYELLQNAEDAGAKHVEFRLKADQLVFAHDGRSFSEDDVWGITNIGKGTKREDDDKIGRFGVGFKAVFAYSETPSVWSPTFNFRISNLVLPTEIPSRASDDKATVFQFPFNNPKKTAEAAFSETAEGLQALSEELLIFLQNIKLVKWKIGDDIHGGLLRKEHPPHLIEVQKYLDKTTIASSCFLRFSSAVHGLPMQNVALAFPVESQTEKIDVQNTRDLASKFRIVPANPARVSVYFPAEKEVSGLRFHLHAPFVPELSRASVKDTPANDPLFTQLAQLACDALEKIRDIGLLNVDFLNVLPNNNDSLPIRYQPISRAIVEAMNNRPLTPTQSKGHLPARQLVQAKAALKELLPQEDLKRIFDEGEAIDWAVTAPQRNSNADRYLSGLEIRRWDIDKFLRLFQRRRSDSNYKDFNSWQYKNPQADEKFDQWLAEKDAEWLQKLYSMFARELGEGADLSSLKSVRMIRLVDGRFVRPDRAFFPRNGTHDDESFPPVDPAVYSSGKSTADQEASRKFLLAVGVREVGEFEQVQAVLASQYGKVPQRPFSHHINDLRWFLKLIHIEPKSVNAFVNRCVLLNSSDEWSKASDMFIDHPFRDTGLSAFFQALGADATRKGISHRYVDAGVVDLVCEFAEAIGAESSLAIEEVSCSENPDASYLVHEAPGNPSRYQIDCDYWIEGLDVVLQNPSVPLARLLWRTLASQDNGQWTRASYRNNQTQPTREGISQLASFLRDTAWVPQHGGRYVLPADADHQSLPDDFEFARGWKWLAVIRFGENVAKRTEEYRKEKEIAKKLGFEDDESLRDAKWFAQLAPDARRQLMSDYRLRTECELPERSPTNPERRSEKVVQLAIDAPVEEKEIRPRSVSTVTPTVKKEIRPYLREQYTNADGVMICQVCKNALPFSLANGDPFFETVELVSEMEKVHFQNYVALCPNHAAMFKYVNESREAIRNLIETGKDCDLPIVLAGKSYSLYLTKTHLLDLRAILQSEVTATPNSDESAIADAAQRQPKVT
jgi:hypothetical protein